MADTHRITQLIQSVLAQGEAAGRVTQVVRSVLRPVSQPPGAGDHEETGCSDFDPDSYRLVWWTDRKPLPTAHWGTGGPAPCSWWINCPAMAGGTLFPSAWVYLGPTQSFKPAWSQRVSASCFIGGPLELFFDYRNVEHVQVGLAALALGQKKFWSADPADASGIFAYFWGGIIWPGGSDCADEDNRPLGWTYYQEAWLAIDVLYQGARHRVAQYTIGPDVWKVWNYYCALCAPPWRTFELNVTRTPYPGDKQLQLQFGWVAGQGQTVPSYQIDTTIDTRDIQGHDFVGFELPCGWAGYAWEKTHLGFTVGDRAWATFSDLHIENTDEICDEIPPTPENGNGEQPPELPPPYVPIECAFEEPGSHLGLHLGSATGPEVYQYGMSETDAGVPVFGLAKTNVLAVEGFGGEIHAKNLYVAISHRGDARVGVTPIVNGEYVYAAARTIELSAPDDPTTPVHLRKEIALNRPYIESGVEKFMHGLIGTTIQFEVSLWDVCGAGLEVHGLELDYEINEESQPDVVFTEEFLLWPEFTTIGGLYIGDDQGRILRADEGSDDAGVDVQALFQPNPIAPEGWGGECHFQNLYITVTRWNTEEVELKLTPIVDNLEQEPLTIVYDPVARPVAEVTELPLNQPYLDPSNIEQLRHGLRGVWFMPRFETLTGLPPGMFVVEGLELDYEPVEESEEHVA